MLLGNHSATDPAEAVRVAIGRALGLIGPQTYPWLGRSRDRALAVTLGISLGLVLVWRLWR